MVFSWHENIPRVFRVFVFTLSTLGVAYQHRYQQVFFENQAVKLLQPMERLNIIWIIIIEIILTACAEMPTPLRTTQTSGHSSSYISNIPLWSLKSPSSRWLKSSFFYLSQSKWKSTRSVISKSIHDMGQEIQRKRRSGFKRSPWPTQERLTAQKIRCSLVETANKNLMLFFLSTWRSAPQVTSSQIGIRHILVTSPIHAW